MAEPTNSDILNELRELRQAMDSRFDEVDRHFAAIKTDFDGVYARLDKVEDRLTGVEDRLTGVEGRLTGVEDRLAGVEGRLDGVEDGMVTKPYLDRALADLKADLIVNDRKLDTKTDLLIDAVERNRGIATDEAEAIRRAGPFPRILPQ